MSVAQRYAALAARAGERWQERARKTLLLVGTATCGRAAGALEISRFLREEVARRGLEAEVIEVGCMGHCYAEPLVVVAKPEWPAIAYGYVTEGIAARLVEDFLLNDDPCLEFVLAALEPNDLVPSFADLPRAAHEHKMVLARCGLIDPEDITHYIATGGYAALARALEMDPAA
ncbi:MAG: NADH-quinone oxidoreductase subunit F, partial [Firmicutes bacterium]|nr:NADH-quinone oxidoreductase subunit F [Bacillota bacterium]